MNTHSETDSQRLTSDEIEHYHREGYVIYKKPVLPPERFASLCKYFENLLENLPPGDRPEAMDVPHFLHPKLLEWAFDESILDLVEPIIGPDITLFSTHFICKPKGNGKRVPWHEDSAYWRNKVEPMNVCTVWLALDPSRKENGCMMVIPRTHSTGRKGFSDYDAVDLSKNVFSTEITPVQRDEANRVYIELEPNECSLHDARVMHGSEPNTSSLRRCGWTLRFCPSSVRFNEDMLTRYHQVYLARGRDLGGTPYADPTKSYPELIKRRSEITGFKNSH